MVRSVYNVNSFTLWLGHFKDYMDPKERVAPAIQTSLTKPRPVIQAPKKREPNMDRVVKKPLVIPNAAEGRRLNPAGSVAKQEETKSYDDMTEEDIAAAIAAIAPVQPEEDKGAVELESKRARTLRKLLSFSEPTTKVVRIADSDFKFKVLSVSESIHVQNIIDNLDQHEKTVFSVNLMQVAAALQSVDDVAVEELFVGSLNDVVLQRYSLMKTWSPVLLDMVIESYKKLMKDLREEATPDFLRAPKMDIKD